MYKQDTLESEPTEFLDPNKLSTDGTVALVQDRFSHDGSLLAYGLSTSGSDWFTIHIKDVATGQDMPEKLEKAKFSSIEWTKDGKGDFFLIYFIFIYFLRRYTRWRLLFFKVVRMILGINIF